MNSLNNGQCCAGNKYFRLGSACILMVLISLSLMILYGCNRAVANNTYPEKEGTNTLKKTLIHEGVVRTYYIHLPPRFNPNNSSPLVLALHGGGGRGKTFDQGTTQGTLTAAADKRGMVLVFPEGIKKQWCDGRLKIVKKKCHDDVGFMSKIIDTMITQYGVDPKRIYATGISNGGFMSVRLAMDLSEKVAAVAPVTAQLSMAIRDKAPAHPISIMFVNGTDDPLVPFDGGHVRLFRFGRSRGEIFSTDASVEFFRRHNGCVKIPKKHKPMDKDPNDGTHVEIVTYGGGRGGTEVVLVKVHGGGHTWPGGKQYLKPRMVGVVSREVNASEMILDFFLNHPRQERLVR